MRGRTLAGGDLSVRASLPTNALFVLGSALFAGACGSICAVSIVALPEFVAEHHAVIVVLVGILGLPVLLMWLAGVALFGFCALFCLARVALLWRPAIEVDGRGITDRSSALGTVFVPWDAVGGVRLVGTAGEPFVGIAVRGEDAFLRGHNPLKRSLMRLNRRRFPGTAIVISLRGLLTTEEELIAAIAPCLRPPARERAERLLAGLRASGRAAPPPTLRRRASRVARSAARYAVLFTLSMLYWVSCMTLLSAGVLAVLVAFGVLGGYPFDGVTLAAGVVLLLLAAADFLYFPRLVERITGRKPLEPPAYWS